MNLEIQPTNWTCLPTSVSMLLSKYIPNHKIDNIFDALGHDGGEIINPDLREPNNRRGFGTNELIDYCRGLGYALVLYDLKPIHLVMDNQGRDRITPMPFDIKKFLETNDCVIWGNLDGSHHAVAWNAVTQTVYNPHGHMHAFDDSWDLEFAMILLPLAGIKSKSVS